MKFTTFQRVNKKFKMQKAHTKKSIYIMVFFNLLLFYFQ